MDKLNILSKEQKDEDKFLIAKILDKIKFAENRNRFEETEFLDLREQQLIIDILEKRKYTKYKLYGGYEDAERKILVAFKDDFNIDFNIDYNQFITIVRIILPNNLLGQYEHKNYLGAVMKLGIKREKIGDILVRQDGADILVKKDISEYIVSNLKGLTRFQKASFELKTLEDLKYIKPKKELIKINIPSMRLDCIVGELARCSRTDAIKYLNEERIFVNFRQELRPSKLLEEGDYITVRGKGRFKINKILGNTRSGRLAVEVEK